MGFDPKSLIGSQSFAIAGGVVIGAGIFTLISSMISNLIQPLFNVILDNNGQIRLSADRGIYLGCGPFVAACIIAVACGAVGFVMVKASSK